MKDEAIQVEVEQVPNETLPVLYNKVVNDDIEEVEYEEVPNTAKRPSDFIVNQQRFVPIINFSGGRLF